MNRSLHPHRESCDGPGRDGPPTPPTFTSPFPPTSPYSNLDAPAAFRRAGRPGGFLDFIDPSTDALPPDVRRAAAALLLKLARTPQSPQIVAGHDADAALLLHALGRAEVSDRGRGLLTLSTPDETPTPSPTWPRLADSFDRPRVCRDRRGGRGVR